MAADTSGVIELVAQRPGTSWIADFVETIWHQGSTSNRIAGVAIIRPSVLSGLYDRLRVYGEGYKLRDPRTGKMESPVLSISPADLAVASQNLLEAVVSQELHVSDSGSVFRDAVNASYRRPAGQLGAFTIARRDLKSDASPLVAAAIALHAAKGRGWQEAEAVQKSMNTTEAMRIWDEGLEDDDDWMHDDY